MPNQAKGEVRWTEHGPVARITIEGKQRDSFPMPTCKTPEAAAERCSFVAGLAARLRKAGVIKTREGLELLRTAAACPPALLDGVRTVAGELIGGEYTGPDTPKVPTFAEMGRKWTSGELHKLHPDHVKNKDSDLDESRLEKLCAVDVGGMKAGDVPIDRFGLDHAEAMMRGLPDDAKRPGTRRGYAQIISRVMALAVYPCRYIPANPLPKGFLPKVGKPPAYPFLYPIEDAALLDAAESSVPLCYRVLWGFLCREGCREGEATAMRIRDFDLKSGTVGLDENKTDDPRTWALDPGTVRALQTWVAHRDAKPDELMFVDQHGNPLTSDHRLAEVLREHLLAAGVDRRELHHDGKNRRKLRVHDLRATFVTLALANDRTETWVADRTGHRSSQMINRYRRQARAAHELGLGGLLPLDQAIQELCQRRPTREEWRPELALPEVNAQALGTDRSSEEGARGPSWPLHRPRKGGSTRNRTEDQRIKKATKPERKSQVPETAEGDSDEQGGDAGTKGPSSGSSRPPPDPVETALAEALHRASRAEDWSTVKALVDELRARRADREGVVDLEAERARRERGGR